MAFIMLGQYEPLLGNRLFGVASQATLQERYYLCTRTQGETYARARARALTLARTHARARARARERAHTHNHTPYAPTRPGSLGGGAWVAR